MTGCLGWVILMAYAILSVVRWFEHITDAVDRRHWTKVGLLILIPPAVWIYKSKVPVGRLFTVPRHEPVLGFGETPAKPPSPKKKRAPIDPDMIAKLKQKMREQGMLEDKDDNSGS